MFSNMSEKNLVRVRNVALGSTAFFVTVLVVQKKLNNYIVLPVSTYESFMSDAFEQGMKYGLSVAKELSSNASVQQTVNGNVDYSALRGVWDAFPVKS